MIQLVNDAEGWTELAGDLFDDDVYYRWEFLSAWAEEEKAEPLGFYFEHEGTRIFYPFLKVSLEALPGGEGRFDVRTPYDFGGPRIVDPVESEALRLFDEAWREYCTEARVVTEFARLHPLATIAQSGGVSHHADNHVVDLRLSEIELTRLQHKNHRWAVRRAIRHELEFEMDQRPSADRIATWCKMYTATMQRVEAGAAYSFSSDLFGKLLDLRGVYLATVTTDGEAIAQALFVSSHPNFFYYLSAATEAGRSMKAANFMLDRVIASARSQGAHRLHLGGGSPSLRHFKGQVATGTVPYSVVRTVHDERAYALLSGAATGQSGEFPAYRSKLLKMRCSGVS